MPFQGSTLVWPRRPAFLYVHPAVGIRMFRMWFQPRALPGPKITDDTQIETPYRNPMRPQKEGCNALWARPSWKTDR
eukprot:9477297-Pyramimonas_sp.AAC.1